MSVRTYVHPVPSGADAQRAHFVGVLGHLFIRTLIRSHCSLIWLLRTARFARTHWCAHSLARLLTHSLPSSWERDLCLQIEFINRLVGLSIHPYVSTSVHHKRKWSKTPSLRCMEKNLLRLQQFACLKHWNRISLFISFMVIVEIFSHFVWWYNSS